MTTDEQGYQGWKNYETWATALWIDNDQALHNLALEIAGDISEQAPDSSQVKDGIWTLEEAKRYNLADYLEEWVTDDLLPELEGLGADLLNAAVSEIEWTEIADHYLDR